MSHDLLVQMAYSVSKSRSEDPLIINTFTLEIKHVKLVSFATN